MPESKYVICLFYRRYGRPCSICQEGISPKQSVRKVLDKVYHISCFSCVVCKMQLSTGDLFYLLDNGTVICKRDLEESKYSGKTEVNTTFIFFMPDDEHSNNRTAEKWYPTQI